eukprot:scaffold53882_cov39-Cyclotella_meneghiniana.AAC.3
MLCGLDWNALPAKVSTGWILSAGRLGLSQCLIVDMLNDVMWSGLECFASKGLNGLDFECREGKKFSCGPDTEKVQ